MCTKKMLALHFLVVAMAFCLVEADQESRFDEAHATLLDPDEDRSQREGEHSANKMRHRRRRQWHSNNNGYDYPPPPPRQQYNPDYMNSYYGGGSQYSPSMQQDLLPQIYRLLEEISTNLRRPPPPPPPPQPIYVPYPVPYYLPQGISSCSNQPVANVTLKPRAQFEDTRQIWSGSNNNLDVPAPANTDDYEDETMRPISFDRVVPDTPLGRPVLGVEHGSNQAGQGPVTAQRPAVSAQRPSFAAQRPTQGTFNSREEPATQRPVPQPSACDAAVLACCRTTQRTKQQYQCFTNLNCGDTYLIGSPCEQRRISAIIESYQRFYSQE